MASKRNLRRQGCRGKRAYTAEEAHASARALGDGLHAYRCPECAAYHIGHPRGRTWSAISERRRSG